MEKLVSESLVICKDVVSTQVGRIPALTFWVASMEQTDAGKKNDERWPY